MLSLSIRIGPVIDICQLYTAFIHSSLTPSCRNEMQEKESGNQEQEFEYVHLSNKLYIIKLCDDGNRQFENMNFTENHYVETYLHFSRNRLYHFYISPAALQIKGIGSRDVT